MMAKNQVTGLSFLKGVWQHETVAVRHVAFRNSPLRSLFETDESIFILYLHVLLLVGGNSILHCRSSFALAFQCA